MDEMANDMSGRGEIHLTTGELHGEYLSLLIG